jgi:hypothetical protein
MNCISPIKEKQIPKKFLKFIKQSLDEGTKSLSAIGVKDMDSLCKQFKEMFKKDLNYHFNGKFYEVHYDVQPNSSGNSEDSDSCMKHFED